METLFIYVLKTNGLLLLFWIFYRIFLKKETFYNTTRIYFLLSIGFALIAPALFFTKTVWVEPKVVQIESKIEATTFTEEVFVNEVPNPIEKQINYTEIAYYIVFTISALLVANASFRIFELIIKINKLDKFKGNIKLDKQSKNVFSFGKWIVVSPEIAQSKDIDLILQHEQLHVNLFHTFDLLLLEILTNLFWFNPLLKRLQSDVILNQEYQVDALLINESNKIRYQMCLLQTQLNHQSSLLCTFNQSDLKKRIVQINNQKSKTMKKLKFLLTLPVITGFVLLFQINTVAQEIKITKAEEAEEVVEETKENKIVLENHTILIYKSYDQEYLNNVEKKLREHYKLDFKFKNVKRNKEGHLTNITLVYNDKQNENNINLTYKNKKGIEGFKIGVRKTNNGDYTLKILNNNEATEGVVYVSSVDDSSKFERNPDPKTGNYFVLTEPTKDKVEATLIDYLAKNKINHGKLDFSKLKNDKVSILLNNLEVNDINDDVLNNLKLFEIYKKELAYNYLGEKAKNGIIVLQTKDYIDNTEYKIENEKKQFVIRSQDGSTTYIKNIKNKSSKKYLIFVDGKQVENADHINSEDIISIDVQTTDLEKYDLKGKDGVLFIKTKPNNLSYKVKTSVSKVENNEPILVNILKAKAKVLGINYTENDLSIFTKRGIVFELDGEEVTDLSKININYNYKIVEENPSKNKYGYKSRNGVIKLDSSKDDNFKITYTTSVSKINQDSFTYLTDPKKDFKTVYILDGKQIEKKNIDYKKVDFVKIVQDEEAKKQANDPSVDIAVILATKKTTSLNNASFLINADINTDNKTQIKDFIADIDYVLKTANELKNQALKIEHVTNINVTKQLKNGGKISYTLN